MKNKIEKVSSDKYNLLIKQISSIVSDAKKQVAATINNALVETYWHIGKYIVEFELAGNARARYGDKLLVNLSKDLTALLGKGFSKSNLFNMRLFYSRFPIFQAVPGKLGWTHLVEIIRIDNELERNFYLAESVNENWSSRKLIQQKERGLFMQLALNKNKKQILALSKQGNIIEKPEDIIKSTYTLDFLNIPEVKHSETVLEDALIENLEQFLLELGKGFILAKEKDEVMVQYAMYGNNNKLFVSKYQMYLPDIEDLRKLFYKSLKGKEK